MKLAHLQVSGAKRDVAVSMTETARERMRGLLGRNLLPVDEALLLKRCASVHTFGMRFAIDVVFLDRFERAVAIHHDLRQRRIVFNLRAAHTLELSAGVARTLGLTVGDQLGFEAVS